MIELGSRRTPPYDDTGVKTSISDLKDKMAKLQDTVDHMDVSDEIKNDILTLQQKVKALEESVSGGSTGATDQQIQSMKADIESFGRVLDAHVQDATKHVSSEDRTKWDGMGDRVTTAETNLKNHIANAKPHVSDGERLKWNQAAADAGQLQKDLETTNLSLQDVIGVQNFSQQYAFTDADGRRKRLDSADNIYTADPGFYYGTGWNQLPLPGDGSWYYLDIIPAPNGMRKMVLTRSYDNTTWIGVIHTDNVFRGWKKLFTYNDFMALTWYNLPLLNGAKASGRTPQYTRWGNVLMLKGDIACDLGVDFAQLPAAYAPFDKKAIVSTCYGTTGITKFYINPDGKLAFVGFSGNNRAAVSSWSLDAAVPY